MNTLADRLNHLFVTMHPRGRGPYSNEEVASAIRERGESMSAAYLWMLRRGERANPTMRHLAALAEFFGVDPAYFFDDSIARATDGDLALLGKLQRLGVEQIALRQVLREAGLSPASQLLVEQVVDRCLELEGLHTSGSDEKAPAAEAVGQP